MMIKSTGTSITLGETAKRARQAKEATETQAWEDSKDNDTGAKRWHTEQANMQARRQHISEAKARTASNEQERQFQFEEGTDLRNFELCASEYVKENKNDANTSTTNPGDHDEALRRDHGKAGKESAKQHNETRGSKRIVKFSKRTRHSRRDHEHATSKSRASWMHVCRARRAQCMTLVDGARKNRSLASSAPRGPRLPKRATMSACWPDRRPRTRGLVPQRPRMGT